MVLLYAVPLMLFAGTVSTPRAEPSQDLPLLIALCVAVVGLYGLVLLLSRFTFRRRTGTSGLAALTASAPAMPFSAVRRRPPRATAARRRAPLPRAVRAAVAEPGRAPSGLPSPDRHQKPSLQIAFFAAEDQKPIALFT
jgi:predicted permease